MRFALFGVLILASAACGSSDANDVDGSNPGDAASADGPIDSGPTVDADTRSQCEQGPITPEFASPRSFSVGTYHARTLHPVDIDGDDDLDLVADTWASTSGTVAILRNDGAGNLTLQDSITLIQPQSAAVDVEPDGDVDLFVVSATDPGPAHSPLFATLFLNDGNGAFTESGDAIAITTELDGTWRAQTADVDGDQDDDVLISTYNGRLILALNTPVGFDIEELLGVSSLARCTEVSDVDGDGGVDIVVNTQNAVRVLRRDGDVYSSTSYPVSGFVFLGRCGAFFEDLDGDGDDDAFAGYQVGNSTAAGYVVVRNSGGEYGTPSLYPQNPIPHYVDVAGGDLDCDDDVDAVVVAWRQDVYDKVVIALNDGFGQMVAADDLSLPLLPSPGHLLEAALADLNGDSVLDIIVARSGESVITVFFSDLGQ